MSPRKWPVWYANGSRSQLIAASATRGSEDGANVSGTQPGRRETITAGVDHVALSFFDPTNAVSTFGERVIPLLRERGLRNG
jgi:hypothetical protein